jgi:predicted Zn-dependent protease
MVYLFWHASWHAFGRQRMKEALGESILSHYVEGLFDSYAAKSRDALKAYAKIAEAKPPHPAVLYSRAVVQMDMGHDDKAESDLRCLIERQPWALAARGLLAELMLKRDEWDGAKKMCEASEEERILTLTFEPGGLDIIASLETFALEALLGAGDVEGAVSRARVESRLPSTARLLATQALALAKAGDLFGARRAFDQALQKDGSVLGLLLRDDDRQLLARIVGASKRSCHWSLATAARALNDGDCRGAAAQLESLAETYPRASARTYCLLGSSYEAMGDLRRAREAYWRGVGLKNDAANVGRLSVLLAQDGKWQELRRLAKKAKNGIEASEVAFELAVQAKNERRILQMGRGLLRKGTGSQYVVYQMACRTKPGTMAYATIISRLVELSPFDFGLREQLVRVLLGLRKRGLARAQALALVRDGASDLRTLLTCAIALAG